MKKILTTPFAVLSKMKTRLFFTILLIAGSFNAATAQNFYFSDVSDTEAFLIPIKHKHWHGEQEVDAHCHTYKGNIVIPSETPEGKKVKGILAECFIDCDITSIVIPASVDTVGYMAFAGCQNLRKVTIEDADTELRLYGSYGNSYCTLSGGWGEGAYEEVYIGRNYGNMGDCQTFRSDALKKVTIGPKVTFVPRGAFRDNPNLEEVEFLSNEAIDSIAERAFYNCPALTSIQLPSSVKVMGRYVFELCTGLQQVTLPTSLSIIPEETFRQCTALTDITIPANIDSIQAGTFYLCSGLKSIFIADGSKPLRLEGHSNNCLFQWSPLETIYVGRNIHLWGGHHPFSNAPAKALVIGPEVTEIWEATYGNLMHVTDVYSHAAEPPVCQPNVFNYSFDFRTQATLHVAPKSLSAYKKAEGWKEFFKFDPVGCNLNGDNEVNVGDVTMLVNMILGKVESTDVDADLNQDGSVNVGDVTMLINIILGK